MTNNTPAPFEFTQGGSPVLVSMPHSGLALPASLSESLTPAAKSLPDTDWYLPELYSFLSELDVGCLSANYSRYVIDLNRPLDDKPLYNTKTTGLFPDILFDGSPLYGHEYKDNSEHLSKFRQWAKDFIWEPYHQKLDSELARLKREYGYAILFDAHSIAARVPMLFDGKLADFNFGTNDGVSADTGFLTQLSSVVATTPYSQVSNGRFKGGYITRSKGRPNQNIHAIQLELSQDTYMRDSKAKKGLQCFELDADKLGIIRPVLKNLLAAMSGYKPELV